MSDQSESTSSIHILGSDKKMVLVGESQLVSKMGKIAGHKHQPLR